MSLFQSTVTPLFDVFLLVSYVSSHTFATPTEVTAVTEIVKDNYFYEIMMSVLPQWVNMDYIDGGQKHSRVKKSMAQMAEAAKMPGGKLFGLVLLAFRNLFSNEPIDGHPPIKPTDAAKHFGHMIQTVIKRMKEKNMKS